MGVRVGGFRSVVSSYQYEIRTHELHENAKVKMAVKRDETHLVLLLLVLLCLLLLIPSYGHIGLGDRRHVPSVNGLVALGLFLLLLLLGLLLGVCILNLVFI